MRLFENLCLLLWKNYTQRKRRKLRLLLEIAWPLGIVFLTALIRFGVKPVFNQQCFFKEKPLPSSGLLPFLRGLTCNLDYSCYDKPSESFDRQEFGHLTLDSLDYMYKHDTFQSVFNLIEYLNLIREKRALADHITNNFTVRDLITNSQDLAQTLNDTELYNLILDSKPNLNLLYSNYSKEQIDPLANLTSFKFPVNFLNYMYGSNLERIDLNKNTNLVGEYEWIKSKTCSNETYLLTGSKNLTNRLCQLNKPDLERVFIFLSSRLDYSNIKLKIYDSVYRGDKQFVAKSLGAMFSFYNLKEELLVKDLSPNNTIHSLWDMMHRIDSVNLTRSFCDYSKLSIFNLIEEQSNSTIDLVKKTNSLRRLNDLSKLDNTKCPIRASDYFKYTPKSSCFCFNLNALISNQTEDIQVVFKQLRPILFGKILFAPRSSVYNELIRRANATFHNLDLAGGLLGNMGDVLSNLADYIKSERETNRLHQLLHDLFDFELTKSEQDDLVGMQRRFEFVTQVLYFVQNAIQCIELNKFEGYESEDQAVRMGETYMDMDRFWAAIIFNDSTNNSSRNTSQLPHLVKYKIRMNGLYVEDPAQFERRFYIYEPNNCATCNLYFSYGFIYLQDMIEKAIIETKTGGVEQQLGLSAQMTPYPCYLIDFFLSGVSKPLPLFIVLTWTFTVSIIVRDLVYEKEKRLREFMQIMGLSKFVYWLAWFITTFSIWFFIIILLTMVTKFGKIAPNSDPTAVVFFYICFIVATISQCYLISTLFDKTNLASVITGIIYFLLYLPYMILVNFEDTLHSWHKFLVSLSSTVAYGYGNELIATFEYQNTGLQWSNYNSTPYMSKRGQYTMKNVCTMLLIDSILYSVLAWYIETVWPGEYGIPRRWYFPIQPSYWLDRPIKVRKQLNKWLSRIRLSDRVFSSSKQRVVQDEMKKNVSYLSDAIEQVDDEIKKPGIEIINLHKVYSRNKTHALKGLSVNFYQNEISAFLGHNGAGKSTTMHLLTGLYSPTSGTARINGMDIHDSMNNIRRQIGFVPQYNVTITGLTVEQHLWFYSRLRGLVSKETSREYVSKMIKDAKLDSYATTPVEEMPSGLKRILSVAIAFLDNPAIVILDEPSAGVDPSGRRSIWDLVKFFKPGRTILMSSHHLEEADVLGDRVAIIAEGRLIAYGTPDYLKRKFGQGYYLTIGKRVDFSPSYLTCDINNGLPHQIDQMNQQDVNIYNFVATTFKDNASLIENNSAEMTYSLSNSPELTKEYESKFKRLEENSARLGISHFKLNSSNMEEVFIRLTEMQKSLEIKTSHDEASLNKGFDLKAFLKRKLFKIEATEPVKDDLLSKEKLAEYSKHTKVRLESRWSVIKQQYIGILMKKYTRARRDMRGLLAETVFPLAFVCLALFFCTLNPTPTNMRALELHPWHYTKPNLIFLSHHKDSDDELDYWSAFTNSPGPGNRCVKSHRIKLDDEDSALTCEVESNRQIAHTSRSKTNKTSCYRYTQLHDCANMAYEQILRYKLKTGDVIYNLSNENVSDWLLETEFSREFFQKRFGGYEINTNISTDARYFSYLEEIVPVALSSLDELEKLLLSPNDTKRDYSTRKFINYFSAFGHQSSVLAKKSAKVWYNAKGFHANVAYLNELNNAILRANLMKMNHSDMAEHGIVAYNQPMPKTRGIHISAMKKRVVVDLFVSIFITFALAFIPAAFVLNLLEERENKFKQLQMISGTRLYIYWLANQTWDLFNYTTMPCLICLGLFLFFGIEAYTTSWENILCVFLLFWLYGWSSIPMVYPLNSLFRLPSTAFIYCSSLNVFIGVITITIVTVLRQLIEEKLDVDGVYTFIKYLFLILFPHFCLGQGLLDMSIMYYTNQTRQMYGYRVNESLFEYRNLGKNLLHMFLQGIVYSTLHMLIQYRVFTRDKHPISLHNEEHSDDDSDVLHEERRVLGGKRSKYSMSFKSWSSCDDFLSKELEMKGFKFLSDKVKDGHDDNNSPHGDYLRLLRVSKAYKTKLAVDRVSLGIKRGECFGLIGFSGAGKTTIFNMMTGGTSITGGEIEINGWPVTSTHMSRIHTDIGYCPQTNALSDQLTAREHLDLFARLRGIPECLVDKVTLWALNRFGLVSFADCQASDLSGGNKRKLSTAVALVGNPRLVLLDEPTSGVDSNARRLIWNDVVELVKEKRVVIFTSHSMEECEALCSRVGVMASGRFKCIGSPSYLKKKFQLGYQLTIHLESSDHLASLIDYMRQSFNKVDLVSSSNECVKFLLLGVDASELFGKIEKNKQVLKIVDYSIDQKSLDELFL